MTGPGSRYPPLVRPPALSFSCAESWDDMPGDDRVRRCARCDADVHNLSALSFGEALAVVLRRGPTCVRFKLDPRGGLQLAARAAVAAAALTGAAHAEPWTVGPAASEAAIPASDGARTLVVSKETGQHAPGVPVTLVGAGGRAVVSVETDWNGSAVLPPLPDGTYTFRVDAPHVVARVVDVSPERIDLVLEQVEPVIVEGDASMASDVLTFVEDALLQLEACPEAPSTAAP